MIGFVANQLDATVQDLTIVVLSHEQSHAYTHLGYDANGCAWELESFHRSELAWIPIQKKKPNNSTDFLPYFRYNRLSTIVFWVYQYTMTHAVRSSI